LSVHGRAMHADDHHAVVLAERYASFVETFMIDGDGLCRSFINAETLAPWRNANLIDDELTDFFQNAPDKSACLTYENSLMSTSEYTMSCMEQHAATGDPGAYDRASRGIRALLSVAREGRHYMPGYLPKPFGGVAGARNSHEISPDQYTKAIRALAQWRDHFGSDDVEQINKLFVDIADFFVARRFRHAYRHRTIVTAQTHHHALGLFVPICVLAAKASGKQRYRDELTQFDGPIDELGGNHVLANFNMASLLTEGFDLALSEGHDDPRLKQAILMLWERAVRNVDEHGHGWESHGEVRLRTSQVTRLASMALIVERHHPGVEATELVMRILRQHPDPVIDMRHFRPEDEPRLHPTRRVLAHSICDTSVSSWLLAYWRLMARRK